MPPVASPSGKDTKLPHCPPNDGKKVAEWCRSNEAVAFLKAERGRLGQLEVDDDRLLQQLEVRAATAEARDVTLALEKSKASFLFNVFETELKKVCLREGVAFKAAKLFFIAPKGPVFHHINYHREFAYRIDVARRIKSGKIHGEEDIARWRDWLDESGVPIPIEDFVCTNKISWRPRRCGSVRIRTGEPPPCTGRYSLTPEEMRTGMQTPKEGVDPTGQPWLKMDGKIMKKLKDAVPSFLDWRNHNEFRLIPARTNLSTSSRAKKIADGKRKARAPSPPRERSCRIFKRDRLGDVLELPVAPPVELIKGNLSENRQQLEEIQQMQETWLLLGQCAKGGEWPASLDWLYELAHVLEHSSCLVWDAGGVYSKPDGKQFRKMNDTCSYVDDDLVQIFDQTNDEDGKPVYDEDTDENHIVFHQGQPDLEYKMAPYAARMDMQKNLLQIDFVTMFRYYAGQYEIVKELLEDWREAFDSINGGFSIHNVQEFRQHLFDDSVFGEGQNWLRAELLPRVVGKFPRKRPLVRVRRRTHQGDVGLPESAFQLVAEMDFGCGWMAWASDAFYAKGNDNVWQRLPMYDGEFRLLGWQPGDELPDEAHDYVTIVHELPKVPDLLPPMFDFD